MNVQAIGAVLTSVAVVGNHAWCRHHIRRLRREVGALKIVVCTPSPVTFDPDVWATAIADLRRRGVKLS